MDSHSYCATSHEDAIPYSFSVSSDLMLPCYIAMLPAFLLFWGFPPAVGWSALSCIQPFATFLPSPTSTFPGARRFPLTSLQAVSLHAKWILRCHFWYLNCDTTTKWLPFLSFISANTGATAAPHFMPLHHSFWDSMLILISTDVPLEFVRSPSVSPGCSVFIPEMCRNVW